MTGVFTGLCNIVTQKRLEKFNKINFFNIAIITFKSTVHFFQKDLKVNLSTFFLLILTWVHWLDLFNQNCSNGNLLRSILQKPNLAITKFSFVKEPSAGQSVESGPSVDSLVTSNLAKFNLNQLGFYMRGSQVSSEADSLTYNFLFIASFTCSM